MSIRKYEVFLKTVDLGNLTRAAQLLGYTQSALSHIIASLEAELGVKLLRRGRSGVSLTEEGAHLLPYFRSICQKNDLMMQKVSELQNLETGTIRIGTFLSVTLHMLPKLIASFRELHPNIEFELLQGNYEDIANHLSDGRIDFGFMRAPAPESFVEHILVQEKFLAIFPPKREDLPTVFPTEALKDEDYLLRPDTLDGELGRVLKQSGYRPAITYAYKDDYAIMALVEEGLGMTILPELLIKGAPYHIQTREISPPIYRNISLCYPRQQSLSEAAEQFVSHTLKAYPPEP